MPQERRRSSGPDRRSHSRGGRRSGDVEGRHPRVLLADSYEPALRPCTRYLEHFLFDVATLTDGESVVSEIDRLPPAVLLIGTNLTRPSSAVVLDHAAGRHVPVIVLADSVDDSEAPEKFDLSAASAVLVKPFTLSGMLEAIRGVLRTPAAASDHV